MRFSSVSLSQPERKLVKKRTKREQFLSEMEAVLPWSVLLRRLKPLYPARGFQGGSPPYPVEMMLRIHLKLDRMLENLLTAKS